MSKLVKSFGDAAEISHPGIRARAEAILRGLGDEYDPENEGWLVVVEEGDDPRRLDVGQPDPWNLLEVADGSYWPLEEQIDDEGTFFNMFVLSNNEFGMSILVPNEAWLDPEFRYRLKGGTPPFRPEAA